MNFFTKEYFKLYCQKNKSLFDKLNALEEKTKFFDTSFLSLERYDCVNDFLIEKNLLKNSDIKILDLGCYMGFYVKFLNDIGIQNAYGVDNNLKSILFGQKFGIKNLYHGDITNLSQINFSCKSFDFISILHVFEYTYIQKNGIDFIYKTLEESYNFLKKGGIIFFNLGQGYTKYDEETKKYIQIYKKIDLDENKILSIGFEKLEFLGRENYLLTK